MNTPPNPFEQNPYQANAINELNPQSDEPEVELASPWARIAAVLVNYFLIMILGIFCALAFIPVFRSTSPKGIVTSTGIGFIICILLGLALTIWQCVWMSKYGQSIGKRLLGIKVIGLEGENPGFVGTVLMREVVYLFITWACLFVVAFILGGSMSFFGKTAALDANNIGMGAGILINLVRYAPTIICVIMLFRPQAMRRTLQDYLAKTVVIKA